MTRNENLNEMELGVLTSVLRNVETLYRKHAGKISEMQGQSDTHRVNIGFSVLIDGLDIQIPKVKTRIRYAQIVTDDLMDSLEDPNQPTLFKPDEGTETDAESGQE